MILDQLRTVGDYERGAFMSEQWSRSGTLRVVRREPYASAGRKVLPLHILRETAAEAPRS